MYGLKVGGFCIFCLNARIRELLLLKGNSRMQKYKKFWKTLQNGLKKRNAYEKN